MSACSCCGRPHTACQHCGRLHGWFSSYCSPKCEGAAEEQRRIIGIIDKRAKQLADLIGGGMLPPEWNAVRQFLVDVSQGLCTPQGKDEK